ncbi:hypothetical protein Syun_029070 [Stephania yunnanensis]|uniref:Peptidase A1 domain-containing protein n=1 Tax=Stephania yunnanensis TaxID=152371 RepID=A0AAP0E4Z5_9MAGN
MAPSVLHQYQISLLSSLLILLLILISSPQLILSKPQKPPPKALILQVSKHPSTLQYITHLKQRSPLVPLQLVVDLNGDFLWVGCDNYTSSTFRVVRCHTPLCNSLVLSFDNGCGSCDTKKGPRCNPNSCISYPLNPFLSDPNPNYSELSQDVLSLQTTDGSNPGRYVSVRRFPFTCASDYITQNLTGSGIAGLGRSPVGMPLQLSSAFGFAKKFAICLPSSSSNGVIFFGDGPYVMLPRNDISKSLIYTPLLINPLRRTFMNPNGEASNEYFIGVKSIKINDKVVTLNTTLLAIDKSGNGGTKITTTVPYTVMHAEIYKAFTEAFVKAAVAMKLERVAGVAPFGVCFSSKGVGSTRVGPAVPTIDLVLQSEKVVWRIFGANSIVRVKEGVLCLGVVDGGVGRRFDTHEYYDTMATIVIGGHQLEDNLLQFDLGASKLGFSSSLLFRQTTCSNFNFTTKA